MTDLKPLPVTGRYKGMSLGAAFLSLWANRITVLLTAERSGLTAIEAAEALELEKQMQAMKATPEERKMAREIALNCLQLGLTPGQFHDSVRVGMLAESWGITARDMNRLREIFHKPMVPRGPSA